ncbi:hypothetical protein [Candidatus Roseilinea sp. NK_OTU-006]|jgi:hypothetical protein|uniref:hypothetical protein n=1 Tax=Candidatus Roseilinea sp. NK_OTU-006 TaxID=2704250 RepID=UPI001F0A7D1B|nr:hypothetical protein [Candidatus Roseilinea sp. NK_OTU-006]
MVTKIQQTQADLVKAITDIAAATPLARTVQLYQFALFLKTHPLPMKKSRQMKRYGIHNLLQRMMTNWLH